VIPIRQKVNLNPLHQRVKRVRLSLLIPLLQRAKLIKNLQRLTIKRKRQIKKSEEPKSVHLETEETENERPGLGFTPESISEQKQPIKRFQRIPDAASSSTNNSYFSKKGDGWGAKANADLSAVRGKDFRAQKTKKKKGT